MMAQFHGLLKTQTGQMLAAVGKSFTANYEKATPAVKRLVDEVKERRNYIFSHQE
jgi:hypothetical protein